MQYTSQSLIEYIHRLGYSDREIAEAVHVARETITRIRLGKSRYYNGRRINGKLTAIVQDLMERQKPQPQKIEQTVAPDRATTFTFTEIARNIIKQQKPQVTMPVQYPPQVKQNIAHKNEPTLYQKFYCMGCDRVYPPTGLSQQEFILWAKSHPCDFKRLGKCPS
jgi:hypothetical protein